jgi:hypothetical protein
MTLRNERREAWKWFGVGAEHFAEFLFQFLAELAPLFLGELVSKEESERGIVTMTEDLFREFLGIKCDFVFGQQINPLLQVVRIAVNQDAVHVENRRGGQGIGTDHDLPGSWKFIRAIARFTMPVTQPLDLVGA